MARKMRTYSIAGVAIPLFLLPGCSAQPTAPTAPDAAQARPVDQARPVEAPRPQGDERLVLAFGDSLYAGYGLSGEQSLPDRLEERLRTAGINATVVNAGVSGDTSAAGRQRLAFTLDNLKRAPDLVILGLGGNDALRQISPAETRAAMMAMMDELERRNIRVLLTGMRAPPNLGPDYAKKFEPIWPDLATKYGAVLYPFILDGVITDPALMQRDGIHPTAAGVERMADAIAPLALKALPPKAR
ncbi:MAG: arylesterase [Sphingomonas bacterium]|nr:arylesterase [Sphingomonas bacterium]